MKKRAVFILALVMLASLAFGVMPVSAAATPVTHYHGITTTSSFEIILDTGESIQVGYNTGIVQVTGATTGPGTATVYGWGAGNTVVNVVNASGITQIHNVNVSSSGSGALVNIADVNAVQLTMSMNTRYNNLFPDESVTVTAVAKYSSGGTIPSNQLRYNWSVSSDVNATVTTSNNGATATIKLNTVPFQAGGTVFTVDVTVSGNGGNLTGSLSSEGTVGGGAKFSGIVQDYSKKTITGGVKAYCGEVTYIYLDRNNNNATLTASSIGTIEKFTNLPRTYRAPVNRSVGMMYYMADASPSTVTFDPARLLNVTVTAGLKKGAGTPGGGNTTTPGFGFLVLPNGHAILEFLENANPLVVMAPGKTQQITSAMLGGVPPTAPLMTYKIADPKVAAVSSTGLITALATGVTAVEVYCNNVKVIVKPLYVLADTAPTEPEEVDGLVIKTASVTRKLSTQSKIRFRVSAANITFNGKKIAHKNLEWSSSKTSIATVDANGYVRIKAKGTCYIYASYTDKAGEEFTARYKVTVK